MREIQVDMTAIADRPQASEDGPASSGRSRSLVERHARESLRPDDLPALLTVDETASLLRTSRKAIYAMTGRAQLPGVTRIGRRVLVRSRELLHWLDQKGALSPKEYER